MMRTTSRFAVPILLLLVSSHLCAGQPEAAIDPLMRVVDLDVGQQTQVKLSDGSTATVKLVRLDERRDSICEAVREARVTVDVNGQTVTLVAANYRLPTSVGGLQIDCAATKGLVQPKNNPWALDADARLRLWPAGSPWIRPGTFSYPVRQKWFANNTQMANEPVFVDGGDVPGKRSIYYHYGLDMGGSEAQVEVIAATAGVVVSRGDALMDGFQPPSSVHPRYDVVYLRDDRGWYYRYSHLDSIDPAVKLGQRAAMGQPIGRLGKEGASGGWSHLHFDISAPQPSGRYGIVAGYAFLWRAYHAAHDTKLQAVARPHHLAWVGDPVTLDGRLSWSADGPKHITAYHWILSDGTTADSATVQSRYDRPGQYTEILRITDDAGRTDDDFAVVQVLDPKQPKLLPPTIHAVYWPTERIKPGDEVTFKVRSFRIGPHEGQETWDFGDGSPTVNVQSDGNADRHAKNGYAVTTHRYSKPGDYLVSVHRSNQRGETATARLHVCVEPIRIVLVGDSTVASYSNPPPDRPTLTGWGQVFGDLFSEQATVINCARSGASSKSFIKTGLWERALRNQPDYVFIQFGHNDCPGKGDRTTDPNGDYQDYLRQYIGDTRKAGARPILVTSVSRRTFGPDGKITTTLQPYADAMKRVAKQENVPLIDLHASSMALLNRLGDKGSAYISPSAGDHSHFSDRGAKDIARLVADALRKADPDLARNLK